jgi:hypothetical protein
MNRSVSDQLEQWAELERQIDTMKSTTLDRIKAAMKGIIPVTELSTDEKAIYDDLVMIEHWQSDAKGSAELAQKLRETAGKVGYDDDGNLVETVGDGKSYRIIKPAQAS